MSLVGSGAFSQRYNTAIGVKGDWSTLNVDLAQFSVKDFFDTQEALEFNLGLVGGAKRFIWLEGMYLYHQPLKNDFDWYLGGGVDFGYWNTNYDRRYDPSTRTGFWAGTTGVFGVEYTFDYIPLNFALDAGPTVRMLPDLDVGIKVGFAARYAFGARH